MFPNTTRAITVGTHRTAVTAGEHVLSVSAGGGGYGKPEQRDPDLVFNDVLDGYISVEAAQNIYRVVIKDGLIDEQATAELRGITGD